MNAPGRNLWIILLCCFGLPFFGCDAPMQAPPKAPALGNVADDHDHDHADEHAHDAEHDHEHADKHEHAHEHGEEHGDEHKHPESYADAVTQVAELCAKVEAASQAGELAKADDSVHEIGHVLEEVTELANKESLTDEDQAAVKEAVEQLLDAFGEIDAKIHGDDGKTYEEVAEQITAALDTLKSQIKSEEK